MSQLRELPSLGFSEALNLAKTRLTDINGRSRRSEFWWCMLAAVIANFVFNLIPILGGLVSLVITLATIPLVIRRLHDTGRSGWYWGVGILLGIVFAGALGFGIMGNAGGLENVEDISDILALYAQAFSSPIVLIAGLVNFIYCIYLLFLLCKDSQPFANKYGESPKYVNQ